MGRKETLEAEVAAAEARLHELKGRQRQLEARNQVLATVGSLRLFDEPDRSLAYAQKIRDCLAQISHDENSIAAAQEVRMWTCQCNSMRIFLAIGDLGKFATFSSSRLDGVMGAGAKDLTDTWYQAFLACTQRQFQAASRMAATNALAQQLHDNSAAEFKTYMQLTSAYRRGILTYMYHNGVSVHSRRTKHP
ncbi:hypothetical protein WJX82_009523 [Trebouxia sp. C0006]